MRSGERLRHATDSATHLTAVAGISKWQGQASLVDLFEQRNSFGLFLFEFGAELVVVLVLMYVCACFALPVLRGRPFI